tara:strand:+ start:456 stop:1643 length:1188 start_codon:yes stop_codon:yes gene_type:complete
MNIAYFNLIGGLSGDMLLSSFFDLGVDKEEISKELKKLKKIRFEFSTSKTARGNINSTHTNVKIYDAIKWEWDTFFQSVKDSELKESIKTNIINCLNILKIAEQEAHSEPDPHLHELGTSDTLVDICGFFICVDKLKINKIYSSPIPVVPGYVKTSHGLHETIAPATKKIVEKYKIPINFINDESNIETVTPTGISILASIAEFTKRNSITHFEIGYGAGTKTFTNIPNVLSLWIQKPNSDFYDYKNLIYLETNLDDMTPEFIGDFISRTLEEGALDTWVIPYTGKKNRPGHQLNILCGLDEKEKFIDLILRETSSLGVRVQKIQRYEVKREIVEIETSLGKIKTKIKYVKGKMYSIKPEFEELKRLAFENKTSINIISNQINLELNEKYFKINN